MPSTGAIRFATGATSIAAWGSASSAIGSPDTTPHAVSSLSTRRGVGEAELSGYGSQLIADIGAQPQSVDSISAYFYFYVNATTLIQNMEGELWSGGVLVASQALTPSVSTANVQTLTFPGVTWAQLSDLRARIRYTRTNTTTGTTVTLRGIGMTAAYTLAPVGMTVGLRQGVNGAFVQKPIFRRQGVNGPFVPVTSITRLPFRGTPDA